MVPWREVCLTLPEIDGIDLLRDEWVDVDYESIDGAPVSTRLTGERARAFQHELDHLDGVLIIDHADEASLPPAMARREHALHDARQRRALHAASSQRGGERARSWRLLPTTTAAARLARTAVGALAITVALLGRELARLTCRCRRRRQPRDWSAAERHRGELMARRASRPRRALHCVHRR